MSKKEVKVSSEERLENLKSQLEDVAKKREELIADLNILNTINLKLQGAIEILEEMDNENKEEKKSD
jgi:uncharacterized protein (DUF3084 family)